MSLSAYCLGVEMFIHISTTSAVQHHDPPASHTFVVGPVQAVLATSDSNVQFLCSDLPIEVPLVFNVRAQMPENAGTHECSLTDTSITV